MRPDDSLWLLDLNRERIFRSFEWVQTDEGISSAQLDTSAEIICHALSAGHRDRRQLGERLAEAGLPSEGRGLMVAVAYAEIQGLITSGARRANTHTYALMSERAPGARRLDREEALAEVARRYLASHGPATAADLGYWATATVGDANGGIAANADILDSFTSDGETYWHANDPPPGSGFEPRAHILQVLDEYYRGYQATRHHLDIEGLRPGGRETSIGMVLVDGQMVGDMKRTIGRDRVSFEVRTYRDLGADESAVARAAECYGRFLNREPELRIKPYP